MSATCVANSSWPKKDWVTTTGPSMSKLNLLAMSVTKYSEAKSTWQSTLATHMLKTYVFPVTSNLERLHAFIILQRKAIWQLTRKECMRKLLMSFFQNLCVLCGYRTNSKFNLDRHSEKCNRSLNQNSTDHTCNICSKKFSSKKILTKHTKLHNRSKCDTPISASSCVVCKKTFVNTWNM